jgi:hypothetical protein
VENSGFWAQTGYTFKEKYKLMNSNPLSLPCSFLVATLVAKIALMTMNLPMNALWMLGSVVICAILLYKRNLVELGVISLIAVFAETHTSGVGVAGIPSDVMFSVLVSMILLPATLGMMGIAPPTFGPLFKTA